MTRAAWERRVDALLGQTQSRSGLPGFTWKPGIATGGGKFETWQEVQPAIDALNGTPYNLLVDQTVASARMPTGHWNLGNGVWTVGGLPSNFIEDIPFDNGATISFGFITLNGVGWFSESTQPVCTGSGLSVLQIVFGTVDVNAGAAPFFNVASGSEIALALYGNTILGGGGPVIQAQAGGSAAVFAYDTVALVSSAFGVSAPGTGRLVYTDGILFESSNVPPTGWTFLPKSQGAQVTYMPGAPGHWAGTPPTNSSAAIDRMAAAIAGLLGMPIP